MQKHRYERVNDVRGSSESHPCNKPIRASIGSAQVPGTAPPEDLLVRVRKNKAYDRQGNYQDHAGCFPAETFTSVGEMFPNLEARYNN